MKEMESRFFEAGGKKLKNLEDNMRDSINKSRENYDMKFLLTTKYVGEKYASLEHKINSTIQEVDRVKEKVQSKTLPPPPATSYLRLIPTFSFLRRGDPFYSHYCRKNMKYS